MRMHPEGSGSQKTFIIYIVENCRKLEGAAGSAALFCMTGNFLRTAKTRKRSDETQKRIGKSKEKGGVVRAK